MTPLFWSSIFFIFYSYFGYPLLLMVLSTFRNHSVKKSDITPSVSFIITAYNEERRIIEKIENTLQQDYPEEKFDIIVASDCSIDGTDEIVRSFQHEGVRLVRASERKGKENAQRLAVSTASGEIIVFSDVATMLPVDGVKNIADEKKEFERKVRTVLRGISVFMKSLPLLNPFKYGLFSWQLFSHKLCRWLIPFAMISAFISNSTLTRDNVFYQLTFMSQVVFYVMAILGITTDLFSKNILKLPSFLVVVNLSILNAWYLYIRGKRMVSWNPSER